jgi:hypothetical protein
LKTTRESYLRDTAIVGRADGRKRRCEQLLAYLVGRGEATVEIEDDRFGCCWAKEFPVKRFQTSAPDEQSVTHHQIIGEPMTFLGPIRILRFDKVLFLPDIRE